MNNNNLYQAIIFACVFLLQISLNAANQSCDDPIKLIRKGQKLFVFHNKIPFELNSEELNESAIYALSQVASKLVQNPDLVVEIGVHNDIKSSIEYSNKVTLVRAELIKEFLTKYGVSEENLIVKGYGDSQILNKCRAFIKCSEVEHKVNRRVEFKIINPEKLTIYTFVVPKKKFDDDE